MTVSTKWNYIFMRNYLTAKQIIVFFSAEIDCFRTMFSSDSMIFKKGPTWFPKKRSHLRRITHLINDHHCSIVTETHA